MESKIYLINKRKAIMQLCYTIVFDTIIALFLTYINFGMGFVINFIFCQCIGLTISSSVLMVRYLFKGADLAFQLFVIVLTMTIGAVLGTLLGSIIAGLDIFLFLKEYAFLFIKIVILSVLFGSIITYIFLSSEKISAINTMIQEEKIRRLTSEKDLIESNLRLIQAQIEPHFLFNTLSNILSLLDTNIGKGKDMLENFICYLQASLSKIRHETSTIGQEIEMMHSYLNIFKVRMGDGLHYKIEVPESIKNLPFPPMLIQPLVENAIKHGLEPRIGGGELSIRISDKGDFIRLEVADTGVGLHEYGNQGFGLLNIRERLKSLYGDRARLILKENQPSGLRAIIEVPHERD